MNGEKIIGDGGGPTGTFITDPETGTQVNVEQNGGLAVNIQDQHSRALDLKFIRALNSPPAGLASPIAVGDTSVEVTNITDLGIANIIVIVNNDGTFNIAGILDGSTTTITVDVPFDTAMVVSGTNVLYTTSDLTSVVGSIASPIIYQISGVGTAVNLDIDITRLMGVMTDTTAMTEATFGGIPALTNGVVLRKVDGTVNNIWSPSVKTNGDLGLRCFDAFFFDARAPSTLNSFKFRNTYAGQAKHGVTIRLAPGDTLQLLVQDDLTAMESFEMMAQGHLVTN